jgi:hypothetical protein
MPSLKYRFCSVALVLGCALIWRSHGVSAGSTHDDDQDNGGGTHVKQVFVIAMENHNWVQPNPASSPQQVFLNPAAPFINSLVDGTSGMSGDVAFATNYQNAGIGVHPSEPNYVWAEAGDGLLSIGTDADPYHADCTPGTVNDTDQHLSAFLAKARRTWRSYQEDANVDLTSNAPLAMSAWTVPLFSHNGSFTSGLNAYTFTMQYNYAAKHNPMVFFRDTNGGCPAARSTLYPPLQQLALDLQHDTLADYTWITPNQYNDQHSKLATGYGVYPAASDQAAIAQGDNFLARVVPLIMTSAAYRKGAAIVLWWDESEGGDTPQFTLPFIVISKHAHANVGGLPYSSSLAYSHSSFLRTMQEIFHVDPDEGYPWLGAASAATDVSALFAPGAIK